MKAIKSSIAEAEADTKRDTSAVVAQLKLNLEHLVEWGKTVQKNIVALEQKSFTSRA